MYNFIGFFFSDGLVGGNVFKVDDVWEFVVKCGFVKFECFFGVFVEVNMGMD